MKYEVKYSNLKILISLFPAKNVILIFPISWGIKLLTLPIYSLLIWSPINNWLDLKTSDNLGFMFNFLSKEYLLGLLLLSIL